MYLSEKKSEKYESSISYFMNAICLVKGLWLCQGGNFWETEKKKEKKKLSENEPS